jgi:hypothetical protein
MVAPATPRPSRILPRASHSHSQPAAVGLASDRAAAATVSSRRRRNFVFVVNPSGANGRTGNQWKQLLPHLRTRFADQCDVRLSISLRSLDRSILNRKLQLLYETIFGIRSPC